MGLPDHQIFNIESNVISAMIIIRCLFDPFLIENFRNQVSKSI